MGLPRPIARAGPIGHDRNFGVRGIARLGLTNPDTWVQTRQHQPDLRRGHALRCWN